MSTHFSVWRHMKKCVATLGCGDIFAVWRHVFRCGDTPILCSHMEKCVATLGCGDTFSVWRHIFPCGDTRIVWRHMKKYVATRKMCRHIPMWRRIEKCVDTFLKMCRHITGRRIFPNFCVPKCVDTLWMTKICRRIFWHDATWIACDQGFFYYW